MIKNKNRFYRLHTKSKTLTKFQVLIKETDLLIFADSNLEKQARELVFEHRSYLENFIDEYPDFATSLIPWQKCTIAPSIIRDMIEAGIFAQVGPMAGVAGAIAEYVGKGLLEFSKEIIVENGGDLFIKTENPIEVGIYAGKSPLSNKVGIKIDSSKGPVGICTSSGKIGHSLSFGDADAATVQSHSCVLADTVATAIGNMVKTPDDINSAIEFASKIKGVSGVIVIIDDKLGAWGNMELIPI